MSAPQIRRGRPVARPWGGHGLPEFGLLVEGDETVGEWWLPTDDFPLLVKILDARDNLSVQVHPDDETARAMGHENGKTEAWYVLRADPGASLLLGLREGIEPESFFARAERGEDVSGDLVRIHPRPGDVVFVPAGTVHALCAGIVVLEVQQISDVTFRVFDWNRRPPRPLHLDEARRALRARKEAGLVEPGAWRHAGGLSRRVRLDCPFFQLEDLRFDGRAELSVAGAPELWFCSAGRARFDIPGLRLEAKAGDFVHFPPQSGRVGVVPPDEGGAHFVRIARP